MGDHKNRLESEDIKLCQLFNNFDEDELKQVAGLFHLRHYKDGAVLVEEGDIGDEMFILLEGSLEVTQKLTLFAEAETDFNKKDKMLIRLDAGYRPIVGEMSLFEDQYERSATMKALGDITVGVIKKQSILDLVSANHNLGYKLFYNIGLVLSARLKKANQDILKLTTAFSLALEKGW